MPSAPNPTRPHCYRCDRPQAMCLCGLVEPVANRVRVHVLQHRAERRHALGTVRLLRVGLEAVQVHVLPSRGRHAGVAPVPLPPGAVLLYPSDDAVDLGSLAPEDRPSELVVIDGTWSHAHRLHRDNPWIHRLPHVRLSPDHASRYRIRPAPDAACLSTVEAVVEALQVLEPTLEGLDGLLDGFDRMIDTQIEARQARTGGARRRRRRRAKPSRAVPDALGRAPADLIAVFAEAAPDPGGDGAPLAAARLTAVSLDGSRVFDAMVACEPPPDDYLLERFGVGRDAMGDAQPLAEVVARFAAFCEAGERPATTVSWGPWTHRFLAQAVPGVASVPLKPVWANLSRTSVGGLATVVGAEGLDVPPSPAPGRAGQRVAQIMALTRHVLAHAPTP